MYTVGVSPQNSLIHGRAFCFVAMSPARTMRSASNRGRSVGPNSRCRSLRIRMRIGSESQGREKCPNRRVYPQALVVAHPKMRLDPGPPRPSLVPPMAWFKNLKEKRKYNKWIEDGRPDPPPPLAKREMLLDYKQRHGLQILVE